MSIVIHNNSGSDAIEVSGTTLVDCLRRGGQIIADNKPLVNTTSTFARCGGSLVQYSMKFAGGKRVVLSLSHGNLWIKL